MRTSRACRNRVTLGRDLDHIEARGWLAKLKQPWTESIAPIASRPSGFGNWFELRMATTLAAFAGTKRFRTMRNFSARAYAAVAR